MALIFASWIRLTCGRMGHWGSQSMCATGRTVRLKELVEWSLSSEARIIINFGSAALGGYCRTPRIATRRVKVVAVCLWPSRHYTVSYLSQSLSGDFSALRWKISMRSTRTGSPAWSQSGSVHGDYTKSNFYMICGSVFLTMTPYTHKPTPTVFETVTVRDVVPPEHLTVCTAFMSDHLLFWSI